MGTITPLCPCGEPLKNRKQCSSCQLIIDLAHPPMPRKEDMEAEHREKNRSLLAKQILNDEKMHEQVIGMLGLDRLPQEVQALSLSALAMEKLHPLSSDYNFTEAHTLIDMGYGMCVELGKGWTITLATTRLASFYLRSGNPLLASSLIRDQLDMYSVSTTIEVLRKLEMQALLSLSYRLLGFSSLSQALNLEIYDALEPVFLEMQEEVNTYLQQESIKSSSLGPDESTLTFPRVDLVANILQIMVEDALCMGSKGTTKISNELLNRMLELDNMLEILTRMSPQDDPGFFASYLRDYIRLFSAFYYYSDLLINNDDVKRIVLLEQAYNRIKDWLLLIPTQFWIPLRPAKIIEIFMRAGKWHERIDPDFIPHYLTDHSSEYHAPDFIYATADAAANLGEYIRALDILDKLSKMDGVNDGIREMVERRKWLIKLESNGILSNVSIVESRLDLPVTIQMQSIRQPYEPETYMKEMLENLAPVLRLSFEHNPLVDQGIAIYGDRLPTCEYRETIQSVGEYSYNHLYWDYGQRLLELGIQDPSQYSPKGQRMEVVVMQTVWREEPVYLLFEGQTQTVKLEGDTLQIQASPLLVLRGVIEHIDLQLYELMEILVMLMTGELDQLDQTVMFFLKKED
ncbi:MAG: hypothetical protein INQ03_07765 [Candidatus Heimdallarchaeota archaeon]|nr:hypothetical protein [Candidatus Heimdallarchaeota archaeon]